LFGVSGETVLDCGFPGSVGDLFQLLAGTLHEERNLTRESGDPYELYKKHVPMWLPKPTPGPARENKTRN
jgi:hypothetical protein